MKEFAERILRSQGDPKPFGKKWLQAFLRRNPAIKVQRARSIDSKRVNGASVEVIRSWFRRLEQPEIREIKPANRHNMDEAGVLEGIGSNGLVDGIGAVVADGSTSQGGTHVNGGGGGGAGNTVIRSRAY